MIVFLSSGIEFFVQESMTGKSICLVCNFPERDESLGTITHWMLSCTCGQDISNQAQDIQVSLCRACGKRIGKGRDGSITQYVFFYDACACQNPVAYKSSISLRKEELVKHYYESDSEEDDVELALRGDRFPTDRFKPIAELGRGASGIVWLARDKFLKKRVAVKVLQTTDTKSLTAFQEEARAISALKYTSIVEIVDFGLVDAAIPYMVLEYVPGVSLEHIMKRDRILDWHTAVTITVQVCEALNYAHGRGVFHRDIQPGNILIVEQENANPAVKLIDFGIAKFCGNTGAAGKEHTLAGTPFYMSPDVALGKQYTASSEVYSLGCVLFEMLSGRPPYIADNAIHVLSMHAKSEIPAVSSVTLMPPKLSSVLRKALAKVPASRYQSAEEFRCALLAVSFEDKEFLPTAQSSTNERERIKRLPSNWLIMSLFLTFVVGCISAAAYLSAGNLDSTHLKPKVNAELSLPAESVVEDELQTRGAIGKKWEVDRNILRSLDVGDDDFRDLRFIGDRRASPNAPTDPIVQDAQSRERATFEVPQTVNCLEISMSSNVTGTGLKYLVDQDFSRIDVDSPQFGDEGASLIPRFRQLRMLGISRSIRLSDKGLSDILKAPTLSTIQLRWMNLPPNACKIISTSKTIRSVNLGHSDGLSLIDFRHLAANSRINTLRIAATKIGDRWVDEIIKMKLNELDINENDLTDAGLQKLARIKTLTKVKLTIGQGITEHGVRYLRQKLPKCRMVEN